MDGSIVPLVDGRLYALANPYSVEGLVTTHPRGSTGFAPMNVYVLIEGVDALLVDTGWTVSEKALARQLAEILPADVRLSILLTRPGEFNSISNVRSLAERFSLGGIYGLYPALSEWVDIRPELTPFGSELRTGRLDQVEDRLCRLGDTIHVGGLRPVTLLPPPLRLLPTCWLYDEATRTLFTSDSFTHAWCDAPDGPWLVDDPGAFVGGDDLYSYLVGSRYWWLADADTAPIARELDQLFDAHEIDIIAPGFGCIFKGRDVVQAQRAALDGVLKIPTKAG